MRTVSCGVATAEAGADVTGAASATAVEGIPATVPVSRRADCCRCGLRSSMAEGLRPSLPKLCSDQSIPPSISSEVSCSSCSATGALRRQRTDSSRAVSAMLAGTAVCQRHSSAAWIPAISAIAARSGAGINTSLVCSQAVTEFTSCEDIRALDPVCARPESAATPPQNRARPEIRDRPRQIARRRLCRDREGH